MTFVCVWNPAWSTAAGPATELATALLEIAPRVVVESGFIWADARGLPATRLALDLLRHLDSAVSGSKAGVAAVPIAAQVAARSAEGSITTVETGHERPFLDPQPIELLATDLELISLFRSVGIRSCGELSRLDREAVEVRFGARGTTLWRLARADDPRRIFRPFPPGRPHASLDFVNYTVRDAERLLFTANALLGSICDALRERGERAQDMTLSLSLDNGGVLSRPIRAAVATANRAIWLRLVRDALDSLSLPCPATGIGLQSGQLLPSEGIQGDLFDRGFSTASAVEVALSRLISSQGEILTQPVGSGHPLPEAQARWEPIDPRAALCPDPTTHWDEPCLSLQLLPEPRQVAVKVTVRRDHAVPSQLFDRGAWQQLVKAAGPDRISGGRWQEPFAREYFRCLTASGVLLWLYRDGLDGVWYLQGWWD